VEDVVVETDGELGVSGENFFSSIAARRGAKNHEWSPPSSRVNTYGLIRLGGDRLVGLALVGVGLEAADRDEGGAGLACQFAVVDLWGSRCRRQLVGWLAPPAVRMCLGANKSTAQISTHDTAHGTQALHADGSGQHGGDGGRGWGGGEEGMEGVVC